MPSRAPEVAGRFYPAGAAELRAEMDAHLSPAHDSDPVRAVGVIAPHAGYPFCGAVAAAVYRAVRIPARVLIVGFKHRAPRQGAFLWSGGPWETPLGDVLPDDDLRSALRARKAPLSESEEQFSDEWSIETQLPWLQFFAPAGHAPRMTALAVNGIPLSDAETLGHALARTIAEETPRGEILMIASSDIAHEHDERLAKDQLERIARALERFNALHLRNMVTLGRVGMCGLAPALVMLAAARRLGAAGARVVARSTSADVRQSPDGYTVAYAGVVVS